MGNGRPANLSPMRTAWPATRPAHSFLKFRAHPLNVLPTGFRFLDGEYPADPLIARERRNILPQCSRCRRLHESLLQILRHFVCHTSRELMVRVSNQHFLDHMTILSNPLMSYSHHLNGFFSFETLYL